MSPFILTSITLAVALASVAAVQPARAAPPGEVVGKIERGPTRVPEALTEPATAHAPVLAPARATLL